MPPVAANRHTRIEERIMWKKSESGQTIPESGIEPTIESKEVAPSESSRTMAVIGPSMVIRGDVTGEESLAIAGRIEGNLMLPKGNVIVSAEGRVKGDIHAQVIRIEGQVEGHLKGEQRVIIRPSSKVTGDIAAARVTLEDGCNYSGRVETGTMSHATPKQTLPKVSSAKAGSPDSVQKKPEAAGPGRPEGVSVARVSGNGSA
jgi:cytoskeletal protein CcmA (bactofilin family)